MSQKVLPLGVRFSRFERRQVPTQQWTIAAVTIGGTQPVGKPNPIPELFVPGEYFDLDEDQQLTTRAFDTYAGGLQLSVDGAFVSPGHRVVDSYETKYEPDRGSETRAWQGIFSSEATLRLSAEARVERWRTLAKPVEVRLSTLSVADAASLQPLAQDVSLVNATSDAWLAVRDQLPDPDASVQLLESWELAQ
jgi:hypothetical protein